MKVNIETQYDGTVEKSYRLSQEKGAEYKAFLLSLHPEASNFENVEMISRHEADGVAYPFDTVVCVYQTFPTKEVLEKFGAPIDARYADYYTIKYPLVEGENPYLKVYDTEYQQHSIPSLPKGSRITNQYGIGIHYGRDDVEHLRDVSFLHNDRLLMKETYGDLYPDVEEDYEVNQRQYALIYDTNTLDVVKVKRYIFPDDKGLFDLRSK
jgi:hypothetical protein